MRLLIDENLSPTIAEALRADGIDACHVRDRGLLAAKDAKVLGRAFAEDRILVTANVGDFLEMARARDVHAGIVFIEDAGLVRHEQLEVVRRAVRAIEKHGDMVNQILRIALDGTLAFEEVPPPSTA